MNVAILFGGRSCEHDISIITGMQVLEAIDRRHRVLPVYVDSSGVWWTGKGLGDIACYRKMREKGQKSPPGARRVHLRPSSPYLYGDGGKKLFRVDVVLPAHHGLNGEDGSLQGLLRLCDIAYCGSDVCASAVGMDKIVMKRIFSAEGLTVLPFAYFTAEEYTERTYDVLANIRQKLAFPLMVKPANLGSSIGIAKVRDQRELLDAVRVALEWDSRIIVENALENFTELNCAVLRSCGKVCVSQVEKPVGWKEFLTFEDKYTSKNKGCGREFPADIPADIEFAVKETARKAFDAVGASGVARVDCMLSNGVLYVNEINTIPGAYAHYLFDFAGGIDFTRLIDACLDDALYRHANVKRLRYGYKPPAALKIKK